MKYILTVADSYSGYVWFFPIKEQNSEVIAEKMLQVFSQAGIPDKIVSDLGTPLVSKTMEAVWGMMGVKHITTAPYNQKANAKIERRHRMVGDNLRTLLQGKDERTWDKNIVLVEWAVRSSVSPQSPISPSELMHGFPSRMPVQPSTR